jgi:hypothetical protein
LQIIRPEKPSSQFRILRENVRRLSPNFLRQKNWLLHQDNAPSHASFFTREFFYQKQNNNNKIKLKSRHSDKYKVIEAELQAVLNALTKHDFQDAFKNWHKRWEWCIHLKE